jgi:PAS domain S-box-containing protein
VQRGIAVMAGMCPYEFKHKSKFQDKYGVTILFIVAAVSAYIIDSAVDAFIYKDASFLGALTSVAPRTFSFRLYLLGSFIILGIFVSRLLASRRKTEERLSALNSYGGKLNSAEDIQQVYELTLDAMEKALGFECATIMVVEKSNLTIACHRGRAKPKLRGLPVAGTRGITVRAIRTRGSIIVPDVTKDKDYVEMFPGVQSELAIPILAEDKILGVLDVESRQRGAFKEKDVTLLEILASHAATAISNLLKRGEIEKRTDQMIQSSNMLQTLMDNIPDGIYFKDAASHFTRINKAMARALGAKDPADATGKTDFDFFTEEQARNAYTDEQRIVKTGQRLIGKVEKLTIADGRSWWCSTTKVPIKDKEGRVTGTAGISRDVTQQKKMEEQLRRYSEHLEELVEGRTKDLKEAQNRLVKSERLAAIGELAGMVGHDLRNPLTGIAGATYYLKATFGRKMDRKAKEMLGIIEKAVGYSNSIINDLLEYSRGITLELTESSPKALAREALSHVEIPENVQVIDLTEDEPKTKVDADKLKRAFLNLIKNALDAMPKGGRLTIKSKKSTDRWIIAFSDTGVGMTKEVIDKLWTPLFTTKAKGMGFGLPICKRIVEAHGGKISVESAIAKGTTFTVTIPINQPEREEKVWVNVPEYDARSAVIRLGRTS